MGLHLNADFNRLISAQSEREIYSFVCAYSFVSSRAHRAHGHSIVIRVVVDSQIEDTEEYMYKYGV
eukprot:scaffold43212_cov71-Phaeocystis_antarctica.AAC.1